MLQICFRIVKAENLFFPQCPQCHAQGEAQNGGDHPAQIHPEQGQQLPGEGHDPFQMQGSLDSGGQSLQEIKHRSGTGEGGDADMELWGPLQSSHSC